MEYVWGEMNCPAFLELNNYCISSNMLWVSSKHHSLSATPLTLRLE